MKLETMNIYAKEGDKVVFTGKNGYDSQLELASKYLDVDMVYTVDRTEVARCHTDVWLKEVPDVNFNSVHFQSIHEHSEVNCCNCVHDKMFKNYKASLIEKIEREKYSPKDQGLEAQLFDNAYNQALKYTIELINKS